MWLRWECGAYVKTTQLPPEQYIHIYIVVQHGKLSVCLPLPLWWCSVPASPSLSPASFLRLRVSPRANISVPFQIISFKKSSSSFCERLTYHFVAKWISFEHNTSWVLKISLRRQRYILFVFFFLTLSLCTHWKTAFHQSYYICLVWSLKLIHLLWWNVCFINIIINMLKYVQTFVPHTTPTWTSKDAVEDSKAASSENTIWRGLLQDLTDLWTSKPKSDLFLTTFPANFTEPPSGRSGSVMRPNVTSAAAEAWKGQELKVVVFCCRVTATQSCLCRFLSGTW